MNNVRLLVRTGIQRGNVVWAPSSLSNHGAVNIARYCSTVSDKSLQRQAYSITNQFNILLQLMTDDSELEYALKLQAKKILPEDDQLAAAQLYIALQNPLLLKYKIDIVEVLKGAKFASEAVIRALGSKDFVQAGLNEPSDSRNFLKDTISSLHLHFAEHFTQTQRDMGILKTVADVEVMRIHLLGISTDIVKRRPQWLQQAMDFARPYVREMVKAVLYLRMRGVQNSRYEASALTVDTAPSEEPLSAYPEGSVVATVEVRCDLHNTYELSTEASRTAGLEPSKSETFKSAVYAFRACISGQVPLEWRMVGLDGRAINNSKY